MRSSYVQSLEIVEAYNLFLPASEMEEEDRAMSAGESLPSATLTSTFYNLDQQSQAGVIIFAIGGLLPKVQRATVKLVMDGLKVICDRQCAKQKNDHSHVPIYPTVFFEEAHMYMDENFINGLIPLIRHLGVNLFFITNTPGELPASVFRLLDNLVMSRMVNDSDIGRVAMCGLADKETIEGFAPELPDFHALLLSAKNGTTKGFPLVFKVRDFELPVSGVTRSMWRALADKDSRAVGDTAPANPSEPSSDGSEDTHE